MFLYFDLLARVLFSPDSDLTRLLKIPQCWKCSVLLSSHGYSWCTRIRFYPWLFLLLSLRAPLEQCHPEARGHWINVLSALSSNPKTLAKFSNYLNEIKTCKNRNSFKGNHSTNPLLPHFTVKRINLHFAHWNKNTKCWKYSVDHELWHY